MISVEQALLLVLEQAAPRVPGRVALSQALGLVLAEPVASDVDSPPHDKAMVDGYAVVASDLKTGDAELTILEEVTAGRVPTQSLRPGHATRIMTGAPVPDGAEAVVMVERTVLLPSNRVRIVEPNLRPRMNIMARGESMRQGQVVLPAGRMLRPIDLGVLAEVGQAEPMVHRPVSVAVLATGDELVEAPATPGPGQIRNSNSPLLLGAAARCTSVVRDLGIARDTRESLQSHIALGLQADVLVLSGGVSAGVLDLVPSVLAELGVRQVFHKVDLKPGKPIWFGATASEHPTLVFGLPGNPVSGLVCFELFVKPAIRSLGGWRDVRLRTLSARLTAPFNQRGDRLTYFPATLTLPTDVAANTATGSSGEATVATVAWRGSADLLGMSLANALAIFPAGNRIYPAGEMVAVLPLDGP